MTSVFVTGTDTGVGKTFVSAALIELAKRQGHSVAGMKPIASGCDVTSQGLRNDDALILMQHANIDLAYDVINPYAFKPAIAPHIAAEQAGIAIDANLIQRNFNLIQQQVDTVIVEGAGGWLVPLNEQLTMADLAIRLGLPVVVVVAIRLGGINHALLTIAAIEQTGLPIAGWVANNNDLNEQAVTIISFLKKRIKAPFLGEIPRLERGQNAGDYLM